MPRRKDRSKLTSRIFRPVVKIHRRKEKKKEKRKQGISIKYGRKFDRLFHDWTNSFELKFLFDRFEAKIKMKFMRFI